MDADAPVDEDDPEIIRWRRDASTSRVVRLLWSLGVGAFFAAAVVVVFWRLLDLTRQTGGQSVVVAAAVALAATGLALGVAGTRGGHLERLARRLPGGDPTERGLERVADAALGTVAMVVVLVVLMGIGRYASRIDFMGVGAGPFTGLAALTLPGALVALVAASFLSSTGALDPHEGVLYFENPDDAVDLAVIRSTTVREVGGVAVVSLSYAQPDGQYVPGPRRIVVPPTVAAELERVVDGRV